MTPRRVVVVGLGNPWRGDDGVGPAVVAALGARAGPDVALVDASGADPLTLLDLFEGAEVVIAVDAVRTGTAPAGHVHELAPETLGRARGSHDPGLGTALALARALRRGPARAVVVAVEVEDCTVGQPLSEPVAAAVPVAAAAVEALLASCERPGRREA